MSGAAPRSQALPALLLVLLAGVAAAGGAQARQASEETDAELPAPPSETDIADAFARMDSDRDGELSLEEFLQGLARPYGSQREGVVYQKLPSRFRVLDADGSGFLEAGEYAGLAPRWQGPGEAPSLAQADHNHDGRIDFREFAAEHAPREEDATPAEATATTAPVESR